MNINLNGTMSKAKRMVNTDRAVRTAYIGKRAFEYDRKRFESPSGKIYNEMEMREFARVIKNVSVGSRVLEVGCGTGRFSEVAIGLGIKSGRWTCRKIW